MECGFKGLVFYRNNDRIMENMDMDKGLTVPKWALIKVRQIRNDFFKPTFLPKNEQTNSTLLLVNLILFDFWKKVKTPKGHFKINWSLVLPKISQIIYYASNAPELNCPTFLSKPKSSGFQWKKASFTVRSPWKRPPTMKKVRMKNCDILPPLIPW